MSPVGYLEKAGNVPMVMARALWLRQERSRIEDASLDPLRAQALEMQRLITRMQEQERFQQTESNLRHTHVPIALSVGYTPGMMSGDNVPLGMDEGMVRLAMAMGVEMARRDVAFEKEAGISIGGAIGADKGAIKSVPGLLGSAGRALKAAPGAASQGIQNAAIRANTGFNKGVQNAVGSVQNAAKGFDQKVNNSYNTARLSSKYDAARAENRVLDRASRAGNKLTGAVGAPEAMRPSGQVITPEMRQAKASQRSGLANSDQTSGQRAAANRAANAPTQQMGQVGSPPAGPPPTQGSPNGVGGPLPTPASPPNVVQMAAKRNADNAAGNGAGNPDRWFRSEPVKENGDLPRFRGAMDQLPSYAGATTPQQQAGSVGRPPPMQTAAQPGGAPPSAQAVPSGGGQGVGSAPTGAGKPAEAATPGQPAQAGSGNAPGQAEQGGFDLGGEAGKLWKRTGLSDGAWKAKLPALALGLGGMYALNKGIGAVSNAMSRESEPANYGGGPQPFQNVGALGYAQ